MRQKSWPRNLLVLSSATVLELPTPSRSSSWQLSPLLVLVGRRRRAGAEVTRVVSALDDDNRFDFNLTATWFHDVKSAFVKRELQSGRSPRAPS